MSHRMKMNQHIITLASPPGDAKLFKSHCSVRFQPVASDMREVISAMKISTSLERIADQSVTIARRAKRLNARPAMRELALLEPPYRSALVIFRDSIRAFVDGDCEHARTLKLER